MKFATPALFAYKFNLEEPIKVVTLEPKFAPRIIGMATSIGITPPNAKITTIPEVMELECTIIVKKVLIKYATRGFERWEKKSIATRLSLSGSMLIERRLRANRIKPKKKIGLLTILNFLPKRPNTNPRIMSIEAIAAELTKASWAVTVVPTLLPKIIPKLLEKDIIPVLTKATVITVTAELD
jgi:hypothetical protein